MSGTTVDVRAWAGATIGRSGTTEEVRRYLNQAATQWPPPDFNFIQGLLHGLGHRPEFLPDLLTFSRKDTTHHGHALIILVRMLPQNDLPKYWAEWMADSSSQRRQEAIKVLRAIQSVQMQLTFLADALENPDPAVQQDLAQCLSQRNFPIVAFERCYNIENKVRKRPIKDLLPLLEDNTLPVRRAASMAIVNLLDGEKGLGVALRPDRVRQWWSSWPVCPETLEELDARQDIRGAAQKWLEKQK
jgi:hypothetical protein